MRQPTRFGPAWMAIAVLSLLVAFRAVDASTGSGSERLTLSVPTLDVGQRATIEIQGRPSARYALVASRFPGLTPTRAGAWCIDLSRPYVLLRDAVRGTHPPLDGAGRTRVSFRVPGSSTLLADRAHFQAVARDGTSASGWALSSLESRVIGNGSVGDFTQAWLDLPNSDLLPRRVCSVFLDVDGDGDPDIVIGSGWERCRLFINDGTGAFTDGTTGPTTGLPDLRLSGPEFAAGDVDGDGDLDLYGANACCIDGSITGQDRLYLNDGHGLFTDATYGTMAGLPHDSDEERGSQTYDVDLADLDADGDLDAFLSDNVIQGAGRVFINSNGSGLFIDGTAGPGTFFPRYHGDGQLRAAALGDFDGNGAIDVFMTGFLIHRLYLNTGGGVFIDATSAGTAGLPPLDGVLGADAEAADLDGDGDVDLAIAADVGSTPGGGFGPAQDRILINDGHGLFTDGTYGPTTGLPPIEDVSNRVVVGDVDRDGDVDLIFCVGSYLWGDVTRLYLNDGQGFFTDSTSTRLPGLLELNLDADLGDVDADGDLDLLMLRDVIPVGTLPISVYFNN